MWGAAVHLHIAAPLQTRMTDDDRWWAHCDTLIPAGGSAISNGACQLQEVDRLTRYWNEHYLYVS